MKINRFNKIKGHRIFRNFSWPEDLQPFGQFNIIYGWNGSGKTTLSSLFRHLQTRSIITEGEVEFEINNAMVAGSTLATAHLPNVRAFNRDFIASTILAADTPIDPIYYLGEDSVEKQKHLVQLKDDLSGVQTRVQAVQSAKLLADKALDDFCITKARLIKELLISSWSTKYNNYDKRSFRQTIEKFTEDSTDRAPLSEQNKESLRKQKNSQPKDTVSKVTVDIPQFDEIHAQAVDLLNRSVTSRVLDELAADRDVSSWVQQGLSLHSAERKTNQCRFCNQPIPISRLQHLEARFNEAFTAFQLEVSGLAQHLESQRLLISGLRFPEASQFYDHLVPALKSAVVTTHQLFAEADNYLSSLHSLLIRKYGLPFEAVPLRDSHKGTLPPDRAAIVQTITIINDVIERHNAITTDFQSQIDKACGSLEHAYVSEALADYRKQVQTVSDTASNLVTLTETLTNIELQIAKIESQIVEHRRPAEELNDELRSYLGRDELRFEVKKAGYSMTRAGQPATELSEGEKTAIAFLYFLKSLQDKSFNLTKSIVVVDDPVSSLDTNALFSAFAYMKERTKAAGQLFIMTHNFGFFRQVKNWFHHLPSQKNKDPNRRPGRFYMLNTVYREGKRSASLEVLDPLLVQYESEYHYLFKRIYDEAHRTKANVLLQEFYGVPNQARRLIETFLAFRDPGGPSELSKKFDNIAFDSGKKTRILRFLHTYSHSNTISEPEHDPSVLSETGAVLGDLLELMKECDPTHYAGMISIVAPAEPQSEEESLRPE